MLEKYAAATWKSFVAMTDPRTGLPADNIAGNLRASTRSGFTSPTNIGSYLWSTVAARDIGLITQAEAKQRMATTLESVAGLERNERRACSTTGTTRRPGRSSTRSPRVR